MSLSYDYIAGQIILVFRASFAIKVTWNLVYMESAYVLCGVLGKIDVNPLRHIHEICLISKTVFKSCHLIISLHPK